MPHRDGLTVAPGRGDAVAFYNHVADGSLQVDRFSLHAGLPAPAGKSLATLWYHVDFARAASQPTVGSGETERGECPER